MHVLDAVADRGTFTSSRFLIKKAHRRYLVSNCDFIAAFSYSAAVLLATTTAQASHSSLVVKQSNGVSIWLIRLTTWFSIRP